MKNYVKYSLIAWMIVALIVYWVFAYVSTPKTALLRVTVFIIPEMTLFFVNLLWLSCQFLERKKKKIYLLLLLVLIALHILIFAPIDFYLDAHYPLDLPHFQERPPFTVYLERFMMSMPPLIISALLWKSLLLQRQREESLELKHQVAEAEAKALKAQINPHFLFNSLNNIYSLSQMKSDKTGDAILNLSEILRFVTYESEKDKVSIKEELKQIQNFIDLVKLKDENMENVKFSIDDQSNNNQIAPMLLLPFIENSFKHSNFEDKEKGWVDIQIKVALDKLMMQLTNSASLKSQKKDKTGGVGMENVKKRLELIYPEKHQLSIKQTEEEYSVILELDLK